MIKLTKLASADGKSSDTVTLTFEERSRSRRRVRLGSGYGAFLSPPRGIVLRDGDLIASEDGMMVVKVCAADETVSVVRIESARALARVAYHLGNRHVALQVGEGSLAYLHDHVLDDMVRALGLIPECETCPFEPEAGAYGAFGGHGHSHAHEHHPEDGEEQEDEHEHEHGGRAHSHAHK